LLKTAEFEMWLVHMYMLWLVIYPSLNRCLGQWFSSQYCSHLLRKPVRTHFCCSV